MATFFIGPIVQFKLDALYPEAAMPGERKGNSVYDS